MERDIELSGGKQILIQISNADVKQISSLLPEASVRITEKTLLIEIPYEIDEKDVISKLRGIGINNDYDVRTIGASLGSVFFEQAKISIILAFILMSITIFALFRSAVPSFIVILAAATDIISTIAIIDYLGVKLSFAVIGALLTIIGYSVDTDILLTNELLHHKDNKKGAIFSAAKTGIIMSLTALAALSSMFFLSGSPILEQIAFVLIIGIIIDIPATWLTNAGILRYWLEKKEKI